MDKFLELARDVLVTVHRPLTAKGIWEKGIELGLAQRLNSTGQTPWASVSARLYINIRDDPNSIFYQVSNRPALFYLNGEPLPQDFSADGNESVDAPSVTPRFNEKDIHILLSTFVESNENFRCRTMTIDQNRSERSVSGTNLWTHPDIVGVRFAFDEYRTDTYKLMTSLKTNPCKLFSFELKKELTFGRLRHDYFQAVSNSSWANEGYLVAIKYDSEMMSELLMLNTAFGIGIIILNVEDISESEILFPAKTRDTLSWDHINKLCINTDFKHFISSVTDDITIGNVRGSYDKILDFDKVIEYAREKGMIEFVNN